VCKYQPKPLDRNPTQIKLSGLLLGLTKTKENRIHSHAAVKVHPIDTNRRIILDPKINVFADPETKVARLREIPFPQLVLLDLQSSLQDLLRLGAPHGDVDGDLFVAADTERSDGVACFAFVDGSYVSPESP
jgi:hypothetical protein